MSHTEPQQAAEGAKDKGPECGCLICQMIRIADERIAEQQQARIEPSEYQWHEFGYGTISISQLTARARSRLIYIGYQEVGPGLWRKPLSPVSTST